MNTTKIEWTPELIAEQNKRNSLRNRNGKSAKKKARKELPCLPLYLKDAGHVYFIAFNGLHKIGLANNLAGRISGNARVWGMEPGQYRLAHAIHSNHKNFLEALMHIHFLEKNTHAEWFDLTTDDMEWVINIGKELSDDQLIMLASSLGLRPRVRVTRASP
jgi:hypothetical protein